MIFVSVTGPSTEDALVQIRRSSRYADGFELRLDTIRTPDVVRLFRATRKPTIATCRPVGEGGQFRGTDSARAAILLASVRSGAHYVDLEPDAPKAIRNALRDHHPRPRIIASRHVWKSRSINPAREFRRLKRTGADILKFAFLATDAADLRHVFHFMSLARQARVPAIAIAMGEPGVASRILFKKLGAWATFVSAERGNESAPGQLRGSELRNVYRADRLNARTRTFGVVGYPLGQSKGVVVHNRLFGSDNAVYCRFPTRKLAEFMEHVTPVLSGFSVTIPHKQHIVDYLDSVRPDAARIGAVNTVVRLRGNLVGFNTDASAALDAIERVCNVKGKTMLVIGAGGAARAIVFEATRRGAHITIANRTRHRASVLAAEFGAKAVSLRAIRMQKFDILVNATSVGMIPNVNDVPIPLSLIRERIVFDSVYNPPLSRLLREARRRKATVIPGTEMYVRQAAAQSALFAGRVPDVRRVRAILAESFTSGIHR